MFEAAKVLSGELSLPVCQLPRPGERVCWFARSNPQTGILLGHNRDGHAVIRTAFGNSATRRFDEIRLIDPYHRVGPNWSRLPSCAQLLRPNSTLTKQFETLLNHRIPPGPRYIDLIKEIHFRGFEIFLVGGTVRDVIAGAIPKDVDLVTTMPLALVSKFLPSMYQYNPSIARNLGFIRIGGTPESGDPFIDLKEFSQFMPGTSDVVFGVEFDRDVSNRDFAMNALYYEPINNVIIDPTGRGAEDAKKKILSFICSTGNGFQYAQIFVRTVKFAVRGFTPTSETLAVLQGELMEALPSMHWEVREGYVRTQLFSKCASPSERPELLEKFKSAMVALGLS